VRKKGGGNSHIPVLPSERRNIDWTQKKYGSPKGGTDSIRERGKTQILRNLQEKRDVGTTPTKDKTSSRKSRTEGQ